MPIYEYSCRKCNEVFSVFQSVNASEKDTRCPKCNSNDVKKQVSSFSCCSFGGSSSSFGSSGNLGGGFGGFGGG
ncbi:MAG: zinc ribbon domain-containing protein [Nitrospirae bacterium]|nr:zinc ribbon domain-containing protein [Nitrospirota bacterium]